MLIYIIYSPPYSYTCMVAWHRGFLCPWPCPMYLASHVPRRRRRLVPPPPIFSGEVISATAQSRLLLSPVTARHMSYLGRSDGTRHWTRQADVGALQRRLLPFYYYYLYAHTKIRYGQYPHETERYGRHPRKTEPPSRVPFTGLPAVESSRSACASSVVLSGRAAAAAA